jgi:DNA-binding PadR family transcriptional regulator
MKLTRKHSAQTQSLMLALLEHVAQWQHGYELSKTTGLRSGTLYPILVRLSDQGVLEEKWEEVNEAGRPPRHVYRLTAKGKTVALSYRRPAKNGFRVAKQALKPA